MHGHYYYSEDDSYDLIVGAIISVKLALSQWFFNARFAYYNLVPGGRDVIEHV